MPPAILPAFAPWLDLAGIAVFAASGALAAAKRGQTLVTLAFFALVTGVGGGTMRDLLIGAPVFWIHDSRAAAACLVMAGLIWVTPGRLWRGAGHEGSPGPCPLTRSPPCRPGASGAA